MKTHAPGARVTYVVSLMVSLLAEVSAQTAMITVTNPSSVKRTNEPVVIPWKELQKAFESTDLSRVRLIDRNFRSLPFQIDDLDGDGNLDEIAFQLTLDGRQIQVVRLMAERDTLASPIGPLRTDAANYKRIAGRSQPIDDDDGPGTLRRDGHYPFDGVGWESELIAYRLYLDERNSIDVQGKRLAGLHWNFIGSSGVDYQKDAYWGVDVLHVGSALGIGGFGFWVNDTVAHPYKLDRRRTKIVARGPVRCVVRVEYKGWDLGDEKVDVTSFLSLYAGDRFTENRLMLNSGEARIVATGIVKHSGAKAQWNQARAVLSTIGNQSRTGDGLQLGLAFVPASVIETKEDSPNHLVLLRISRENPLRYLIFSRWQGEGGAWNRQILGEDLANAYRRLNEPMIVQVAISVPRK